MNTKKSAATPRKRVAVQPRKPAVRRRPLHKRMLLHPVSVMLLLSSGVVLAGTTFPSLAASFGVTATVPAPAPGGPAIIATPYPEQHFPTPAVAVAGSCPAQSYVKLFRGAAFGGVSQCVNHGFRIETSLNTGPNRLQAKVYNVTDQEGPISEPIVVYYDATSAEPALPKKTPVALTIITVDAESHAPKTVRETSQNPTITGFAPPFADIVITFHSRVVTCKTKADTSGWWSCTLDTPLEAGKHQVDITATTQDGAVLSFPSFHIAVAPDRPSLFVPLAHETPLTIITDYRFQSKDRGEPFSWVLSIEGGSSPYAVSVEWDDDSTTNMNRADGAPFTVTHAFPESHTYAPLVRVTDKKGGIALIQLSAVVKGVPPGTAAAAERDQLRPDGWLSTLRKYLWAVWPAYGVVALMTLSFWLGEQEVIRRLTGRKQPSRRAVHHTQRP